MSRVTDIRPQKRRKHRSNVYLDGQFAFGLSDAVVARLGLGVGTELTDALKREIIDGELRAEAFEAATRLLGMRPHGEQELRTKLRRRDLPAEVIDAAVAEVRRLGYLDDARFAEAKAADAARAKGHGSRRALAELRRAGVDEATAEAAVGKVYAEHDDDAVARALVEKKLRSMGSLDDAAKRRRLYGMLARRGYDAEQAQAAIAAALGDDR